MTDIASDIRAETARILARHFNSGIPDAMAAIRVATVQCIAEYVEHAEARACTCQDQRGFEIDVRRDKPVHAMFLARRLERMAREEGRSA
jgi:hypothetical protein